MNQLLKRAFDKMGYTYEFLSGIHTDHYNSRYVFQDEGKLVLALKKLREEGARIVVLPDFDMDGIAAGCAFYSGLSLLGFNVSIYDPSTVDGYGIDFQDIDRILAKWPDTRAILTCDVGIDAGNAIAYAQSKEIWVYVTDHHIESARTTADSITDPSRRDSEDPFKGVCGAYMAWHVLTVYAELTGNPAVIELIRKLVLFAGMGTCGDLMPMLYDSRNAVIQSVAEFNRLLDCDTLDEYFGCTADMLPEAYTAPFWNLRNMHMWLVGEGKIRPGDVTDSDYGFTYCPMFNSVKRMGEKMSTLYGLLYERGDESGQRALYKWLYDLNEQRKAEVAAMMADILEHPKSHPFAPFAHIIQMRPGLLGLVAMKLIDLSGLPTFVLVHDGDVLAGSGRTPEWFPLSSMEFDGVKTAGHEHSFGISIQKSSFMDFMQHMDGECRRLIEELKKSAQESGAPMDPRVYVSMNGHHIKDMPGSEDYDFSVTRVDDYDVCYDYCIQKEKLRPYGNGFPEPEFVLSFSGKDIRHLIRMGAAKQHLKLELDHNIYLVWFNEAGTCGGIGGEGWENERDYAFSGQFQLNEFNNSVTLQFKVNSQIC